MAALQRLDFIPGNWKLGSGGEGLCIPVSEFSGFFPYLVKRMTDSMVRSMHTASLCILSHVGYWR